MPSPPASYQPLDGSERRPAPGARRVGPADQDEALTVTLHLRAHVQMQANIDRVTEFAKSHGLTIVEANAARRTVVVAGTVKQMSDAFAVELSAYESPRGRYRGREGFIYLPPALKGVVDGVFGLDNRPVSRRRAAPAGAAPLTPPQVAQLYSFPSAGNAAGQTVGILEFGGGFDVDRNSTPTDIKAFFDGLGLVTPVLTVVGVDGATNKTGTGDDTEVALDIDVCGSVAQGAGIAVYFAPNTEQGWLDAVATAIHPNAGQPTPAVISISWSGAEDVDWTRAGLNAVGSKFSEAADLGVTVLVSSGDQGSDCGVGDGNAHVEYPASDPFVTACGGTIITNVNGSSFSEDTWNDDTGATGGGVSAIFGLPSWQIGAGVPASANAGGGQGRGVPDIAGNASPYSGYSIQVHGNRSTEGGTSAVAPLYAGLVALINASLGISVGYLNPVLYAMSGGFLKDINDGVNNRWSNEANPAPSYSSGQGWDACTGLGSVNGKALLHAIEVWVFAMHRASD